MRDVIDLRSLLVAITTTAIACGSTGDGAQEADASTEPPIDGGALGHERDSGRDTGASSSGDTSHCVPQKLTMTVPYDAPRCYADGGELIEAGDAGDAGDADAVRCESHDDLCRRVCRPASPSAEVQCTVEGANEGIRCVSSRPCGRAHDGLPALDGSDDSAAGWLASAAWLEAASVTSFEILARELEAHGAPGELVAWATTSAEDERRHARAMTALAERRGAEVRTPPVPDRAARALFDVLLENAVEGQVRETYGALVAWHQSACAADGAVRAEMRAIAEEETSHASLAWAIAAWGEARLSRLDRARIDQARRDARAELLASLTHEPAPALVHELGLPSAARARTMASELSRRLT